MANDTVILNQNAASFVESERDSGETNIYPGHLLTVNSSGEFQKVPLEAAPGDGTVADLPSFDPDVEMGEDLTSGNVGERIRGQAVGIGGEFHARLAAGGDLTNSADADVSVGDTLKEVNLGAVAFPSTDTAPSAVSALYRALETVDNSGAAAGVDNQVYIKVRRVA